MAEMYAVSKEQLTDIADAIRLKRDITDEMTVDDMPMEIGLIDGAEIEKISFEFEIEEDNFSSSAKSKNEIHDDIKPLFADYGPGFYLIVKLELVEIKSDDTSHLDRYFKERYGVCVWRSKTMAQASVGYALLSNGEGYINGLSIQIINQPSFNMQISWMSTVYAGTYRATFYKVSL